MINPQKMIKHMAWANQEVLSRVASLPDEALGSFVVNPDWTVREIIAHIVRSSHFYGYRLQMSSLEAVAQRDAKRDVYLENEKELTRSVEVLKLLSMLQASDQTILDESHADEGIVYRVVDGALIERARSTIIFQAIHHATEHRAQLVSALESGGYSAINLDEFDLWAYADKFGE